ncbi:hypothetical protein KP509_34G033400 [Ceratopteris richardii]|uniref:Uncharacterized protein n=1 Tax=Ceratopteris richardii TaxID=49495 RepID=A0A8T2QL38_CERRI|nr:hypothetical protein KP509_34G033400 [Ceratopteris richardii]
MIKRQFYSLEHRSSENRASSESSSSSSSERDASSQSSSDDDDEVQLSSHDRQQEGEVDEDEEDVSIPEKCPYTNDIDDEEGIPSPEQIARPGIANQWADLVAETMNEKVADFADECVLSCKKVLKCRLCPKTICLSKESMQAHLASKKHARSVRLMSEGRLKVMLNSDGEEEEQGETHAERHARILAAFKVTTQQNPQKRKASSGRQRQRKRAKNKAKRNKERFQQ